MNTESTAESAESAPLVPFLRKDDQNPYLCGSRCDECGHVFVGEREVCAKCTVRGKMSPTRLSETGKLYDFTIVYRSFPGVDTPFVDAIVDLDDGAHLKGTLLDIDPNPDSIQFDMPVKIVYREVEPVNAKGTPYLSYFFVPA